MLKKGEGERVEDYREVTLATTLYKIHCKVCGSISGENESGAGEEENSAGESSRV